MPKATPRPWWNESGVIHASNGRGGATHPARCDNEEDATLIVRAVNNLNPLVEALEALGHGPNIGCPLEDCLGCEAVGVAKEEVE